MPTLTPRGAETYQGKPCKNGHVGIRFARSRDCIECSKERSKSERQKAHNRKYMAKFRAANPDYMKQYREKVRSDPERMDRKRSQSRAWYYTEKGKAYKDRYKFGLYGLTRADYEAMLAAQNNCCAICKTSVEGERNKRFHIDHDHTTGENRGLLCSRCNVGIGMFAEAEDRLLAAIEYLRSHRGNG